MNGTRLVGRLLGGGNRAIAATVYGTVLAMAALAAGARGQVGGLLTLLNLRFDVAILGALAGPAVLGVYAIATKYVDLLRLPGLAVNYVLYPAFARSRLDWAELNAIGRRELPILGAAALPASVLLLGSFDVISESPDIWLAFGLGFAALAVQGARYARVERLGPAATIAVIAANLALGGIVVMLKVLVSH